MTDSTTTFDRRAHGLTPSTVIPGAFAPVMASGIVSIGAQLHGFALLSGILFWCAVAFYLFFGTLTGLKLVRHPRLMLADLRDPRKAFGFFTFVAATNVLATALIGIGILWLAVVLFLVAVSVWAVLGYVVPFVAVHGSAPKPTLTAVNGTWFIWVVASQSVAIVASGLAHELPATSQVLAIVAVASWSVGIFLYACCGVFLGIRAMLFRMGPEDLDPPYWVTMGAMAISVVAGARIVLIGDTPMTEATRVVIGGTSVIFWSFATWLIPILFFIGVWRHVVHRIPLHYTATLWSMVFPLGMYAVAGIYLGQADDLPIVGGIGQAWFWVGLAAWSLTTLGMIAALVVAPRRRGAS